MQESFGDFFDSKMKNRSCMKNRFFIEYKNPKNFYNRKNRNCL